MLSWRPYSQAVLSHALRVSAVLCLGLSGVVLGAEKAGAAAANPPWSGQCPQSIVLVLDRSASMDGQMDEVHDAAKDLVDALRGAPNTVGVVSFGTAARLEREPVRVDDQDDRRRLKDLVDGLDDLEEDTNWEAALTEAARLEPQLVVLLTDGVPTVYGTPAQYSDVDDLAPVSAAATAADRLKQGGTRVVAVQIGEYEGAAPNLAAVTGPTSGDDYYVTGVNELVDVLYDVARKACDVPLAALPAPEPPPFPVLPVLGGGGLVVAATVGGGVLLSRRRREAEGVSATVVADQGPSALPNPTIRLDDLAPPEAPAPRLHRDDGSDASPARPAPQDPRAEGQSSSDLPKRRREVRRTPTDRIRDYRPPPRDRD